MFFFRDKDLNFFIKPEFFLLSYVLERPLLIEAGPGEIESVYITSEEYNIFLDYLGDFLSIFFIFLFLRWLKRRYLTKKNIIDFLMKL